MGRISSSAHGPLVNVFCKGTSRPTLRYSGMFELLRESAISLNTFSLSYSFLLRMFPSKQSGPSPLLKLDYLVASLMSSKLKSAVVLIISSSSDTSMLELTYICSGLLYISAKYSAMTCSTWERSSKTSESPVSLSLLTLETTGWFLLILRTLLAT
jgi:hypothetical protein